MPLSNNFANTADCLLLLEVTPDGCLRYLDISQPFANLLERPRAAVAGTRIEETMPAGVAGQFLALGRRCLETGAVVAETVDLDLPQGRQASHCLLIPLRDAAGHIQRIFGRVSDAATPQPMTETLSRDASSRLQAQQALTATEEKYRTIFEESFDGLFITSRNGAILDLNRKLVAMFGYDSKEEMQRLDLITGIYAYPDDRQRLLAEVNAQGCAEFEVEFKKKDGSRMMTHCAVTAVRDPWGVVTAYRKVIRDITAQKRAEGERQDHLRFLEAMDRVNLAMQGTSDLEAMMGAVLDTVLDLFACDRAFLTFPCDPRSPSWLVAQERTLPHCPAVLARGMEMSMSPPMAEALRLLLTADGPLAFGPGDGQHPLPAEVSECFGLKSFLSTAIYPLVGKPWQFGVHQCSHARIWTAEDKRLLQEVGRRLADSLSTLLASRDLRESESLHRSLVTAMAEGVIYQVADGTMIAINPAAEAIFGLTASEMRGRRPADLAFRTIHGDGSPFPVQDHPALITLRTGVPQADVTMGVVRADQGITWTSVNSQPLSHPGTPRPYAVVTTIHDITARKQAEDLVRQREREFRSLAENLPAHVARYDRDGRMIYCSRSLAEFLGLPYEQAISVPLQVNVGADSHWAEYRQTLRDVIATGDRKEIELEIADKKVVHLIRFAPERDAGGEIVGAITIGRDITEYKLTQTRLRRQADDLSETNSALKVLLQHNQQAEIEIQKKCLANIETLILPYLDQLGSCTVSPEGRACLRVIRKNLQGLALSSMSKLSASALGLTPREVVVADLIRKDYTSKDIADFLNLSAGTVESYRDQIREKLGLKNQKVNLRNYLRHHFNE